MSSTLGWRRQVLKRSFGRCAREASTIRLARHSVVVCEYLPSRLFRKKAFSDTRMSIAVLVLQNVRDAPHRFLVLGPHQHGTNASSTRIVLSCSGLSAEAIPDHGPMCTTVGFPGVLWSSSSEERQQSFTLRLLLSEMPARGCCADLHFAFKKVPGSSGIWIWAVKTTTGPRQAPLRLQASAWRLRLDLGSSFNRCLQTHINVNPKQPSRRVSHTLHYNPRS